MWNDNKTFGISKRSNFARPPKEFAKNQNMGNKLKKGNWQNNWMGSMAMGECKNWQNNWMGSMAMGECRNSQRKSCIAQRNCKHIEGGYGRLSVGDVYTCHGIPSRTCKFKKN